jgi:hypothetical protein
MCSNGCTDQTRYFDTYDEYQAFAPATLCQ